MLRQVHNPAKKWRNSAFSFSDASDAEVRSVVDAFEPEVRASMLRRIAEALEQYASEIDADILHERS